MKILNEKKGFFVRTGTSVFDFGSYLYFILFLIARSLHVHVDSRLSSDPTFTYFFDPAPTIPTFTLKFLLFPTFSYFFCATSRNYGRLPHKNSE